MLTSSLPLGSVAPATYERLRACPLHAAFKRAHPRAGSKSAAAVLGDIAHGALERYVRGHPTVGDRETALERAWADAAEKTLKDANAWRDLDKAEVVRAELSYAASRLDGLLDGLPEDSTLHPECELTAASGRLYGFADLVVRGPIGMLIDYKSGRILADDATTKAAYERQLLLYGYMEQEMTGIWPSRLTLVPFVGPVVDIEVNQEASRALATEAIALLDEYEARVPGGQPARPSLDACRWCPYAAECDPFWADDADEMRSELTASQGAVAWLQRDAGRVTFAIEMPDRNDDVVVRAARSDEFSVLDGMCVGDRVRVVGLRPDRGGGAFRAGERTRFHIG